jgi:hypothetical protein
MSHDSIMMSWPLSSQNPLNAWLPVIVAPESSMLSLLPVMNQACANRLFPDVNLRLNWPVLTPGPPSNRMWLELLNRTAPKLTVSPGYGRTVVIFDLRMSVKSTNVYVPART